NSQNGKVIDEKVAQDDANIEAPIPQKIEVFRCALDTHGIADRLSKNALIATVPLDESTEMLDLSLYVPSRGPPGEELGLRLRKERTEWTLIQNPDAQAIKLLTATLRDRSIVLSFQKGLKNDT